MNFSQVAFSTASSANPFSRRNAFRANSADGATRSPQIKPSPYLLPERQTIHASTSQDRKVARRSLSKISVPTFDKTLCEKSPSLHPLTRRSASTLQINIGLTCNLACRHCHVESSPSRLETMSHVVAERLVELVKQDPGVKVVDITGGAPEMHREFRFLVEQFSALGLGVIDRCNLTVMLEDGQDDLEHFLAAHHAHVIASLPCYSAKNVEAQRGDGVFDASILALQRLNAVGYGKEGTGLQLDLVYNPTGPSLPPPQDTLETDYKRELKRAFDIDFSNLICITNMPIKRFADDLLLRGDLLEYMQLLVSSFNGATVDGVMCRDQVHVAWDGSLYDCDFNYALELGVPGFSKLQGPDGPRKPSVFDIESFADLSDKRIATGKHCYGCTAGSGSSCGGSLA